MVLKRPLCGNLAAHDPHGLWNCGYTVWNECPGWSEQEADAAALSEKLNSLGRDWAWPRTPPTGTCLYCHPAAYHALLDVEQPSFSEFTSSLKTGVDPLRTTIPVQVTVELDYGAWVVDSDAGVIAEGKIRDDRTAVTRG